MDANYTVDETLGEEKIAISELEIDVPKEVIFQFSNGSKVHTLLSLTKK